MLYIRKANWFAVLNEYSDISTILMGRVLFDYATSVKSKVMMMKRKAVEEMENRADYHFVQVHKPKVDTHDIFTRALQQFGCYEILKH